MNDVADSEDVIGSKDAALLPKSLPGRAIARTGHAETTEFQVAYAGGHSLQADDMAEAAPVEVYDVDMGQPVVPPRERSGDDSSMPSDLQVIAQTIRDAAEQFDYRPQPPPWLPTLPEVLPLADLPIPERGHATLGLVDVPARQAQIPRNYDLAEGSLLIYGTSGSGKTTVLRSMLVSLARQMGPEDLHLYAMEFGARGLGSLERLPQCGSVIPGDDVERVQRLFAVVEKQLGERRDLFARIGVTNLREYQDQGSPEGPRPDIVIVLDGYSGFASTFEKIEWGAQIERLPQLVTDGRSLGITFLITAERRGAIPMALSGVIPNALALRMADADDFGMLGLDQRQIAGAHLPPGRGFIPGTMEIQTPIVGADSAGEAQVEAVAKIGEELTARFGDGSVPRIGSLPMEIERSALPRSRTPCSPSSGSGASTSGRCRSTCATGTSS